MGRITVFTGNDPNSKLALLELERRQLPYTEISVTAFPDRLRDLEALAEFPSVPQVFLNTRYVGGVENLKKELRRWDRSSRYASPLEKYEAEIASGFDPANERLALPKNQAKIVSHAVLSLLSPVMVKLPDGTMTSLRDITEKLKNTLPTTEVRRNGVVHNFCFSGDTATDVFMNSLGISPEQAIQFGNDLMQGQVIQPLVNNKGKKSNNHHKQDFVNDPKAYYRLQCFHEPAVLNSYCVWQGSQATGSPAKLVVDLIRLLDDIETSAVDERGQLDYFAARKHDLYPLLEESICELQKVSLDKLASKEEKFAFGLNVYLLMMRYAFFKVGIPLSEPDRLHFLAHVKFNIGGTLYSFDEWSDVLLGHAKKSKASLGVAKVDPRAMFAMHSGAVAGSVHSLPFSVYEASKIGQQLTMTAKVFLGDDTNMSVNRKKGDVAMTNLFKLKRTDFDGASETDLLEGTLDFLNGKKKSDTMALIETKTFRKIKYNEPVLGRHTNNSLWYDKEALEVDEKGLRGMLKRFRPPKKDKNERARLATLRSLNVLDTLEEERYDRITAMVRTTFDLPLVFVSLVDQNRQWFKSTQWHTTACPRVPETGRDVSFCGHAIHNAENEIFVIPNALDDERFADNPLVTGDLGIRFYAGVPLAVPAEDGSGIVNIGTLCMIDRKPRDLTREELEKFREFGEMIRKEIMRRDTSELCSNSGHSTGCTSSVDSSNRDDVGSDWDE